MSKPQPRKCPACGETVAFPPTAAQVNANRKNAKLGGWPKGKPRKRRKKQ